MINIKKSQNADTRTADDDITKEQLLADTESHISDVTHGCDYFADMLQTAGERHDHTKTEFIDEFYDDFMTRKTGEEFKALGWWQKHKTERHHLNDRVPDDVNLVDVIEMVVDGVMAGMARSGSVYPIQIADEILQLAVTNTQKLLESNVNTVNYSTGKKFW